MFILSSLVIGSSYASVSLGIDELEKSNFALLKGKRIGLVTNQSGADSRGRSAVEVFDQNQGLGEYRLMKLFGPEHGIDGQVKAGREFSNSKDKKTGLPVYALYNTPQGNFRHPTPQMFAGLDAIVYDVQDIGNRSYTFISTLGYVMDEAAKDKLEVIVLDRPNPLGGLRIEGPRLGDGVSSFVGLYDIPVVYGLTPGELAQWINAKYLVSPCKLTVVPMKGYSRSMVWEDTGLKWIPTSPYIPTIGAARGYSATGLLGEIGIENGIDSPFPFQAIAGRNWPDKAIATRFNALDIPGIRAKPYRYHAGSDLNGIYLNIDPRNAGNLTAVSLLAIDILRKELDDFSPFAHTHADQRDMFDKCFGNHRIRRHLSEGRAANEIIRSWDDGVAQWADERRAYLIYGTNAKKQLDPATPEPAPVGNKPVVNPPSTTPPNKAAGTGSTPARTPASTGGADSSL